MARIAVVGLGKLGTPLAAVFASKGHKVIGMDLNKGTVAKINNHTASVDETDLREYMVRHPFTATTSYIEAVQGSDTAFIIVPTPSQEDGSFTNEYVLQAIRGLGEALNGRKRYYNVVVCSTVMPGSTAGVIAQELETATSRLVGDNLGLCYCADDQTEIFTQRGWMSYDEVQPGDLTLSVNKDDGESYWNPIESVFRERRVLKMRKMVGASHDSQTTLNHRWLVRGGSGRTAWKWTTTEDLLLTDAIPTAARRGDAPQSSPYSDDFAELVGWFWTEGAKSPDQQAAIFQSNRVHPEHCKRIRELLTRLYGKPGRLMANGRYPADYSGPWWNESARSDKTRFALSAPIKAELQRVAPRGVLSLAFLLQLTVPQLDRLIESSLWGDGDARGRVGQGGPGGAERSEGFLYACLLAGRSASLKTSGPTTLVTLLKRDFSIPLLAEKANKERRERGVEARDCAFTSEIVEHDGIVWCPTVPMKNWLARRNGSVYFTGNSPEFIALGSVIQDLLHPDMVLIGESDKKAGDKLARLMRTVNDAPIRRMSITSAEIAKISVNAYVTMKISFANVLAEVCENTSTADALTIANAIGMDSRIGRKYLTPAVSFGGPCFPRDSRAFAAFAAECGSSTVLADATAEVNERQYERIIKLVEKYSTGSVAVLGLTYKPDTAVTEESFGRVLSERLRDRGFDVKVHDPKTRPAASLAFIVDGVSVVVLATPWPEYATLAPTCFERNPQQIIIDCWNIIPAGPWEDLNIYRVGIG